MRRFVAAADGAEDERRTERPQKTRDPVFSERDVVDEIEIVRTERSPNKTRNADLPEEVEELDATPASFPEG